MHIVLYYVYYRFLLYAYYIVLYYLVPGLAASTPDFNCAAASPIVMEELRDFELLDVPNPRTPAGAHDDVVLGCIILTLYYTLSLL